MTAATDRMAVLWYLGSDGSIQRNELAVPGSESVSCVHWAEDGNLLAMGNFRAGLPGPNMVISSVRNGKSSKMKKAK